jgi:hypothetical protein
MMRMKRAVVQLIIQESTIEEDENNKNLITDLKRRAWRVD